MTALQLIYNYLFDDYYKQISRTMNRFRSLNNSFILIILSLALFGCSNSLSELSTGPSTSTPNLKTEIIQPTKMKNSENFEFPPPIDPAMQYLFYLHGKIIEDQGIPAISPVFGEYQYETILKTLSSFGFAVISEIRSKDTDSIEYAKNISSQIKALINAGVPPGNITVVGASKGAGITIFVSNFLHNEEVNFVLMGICSTETAEIIRTDKIYLVGNVLSIYETSDELAGSCQDIFSSSFGERISRSDEVVLTTGLGHGFLYQPLDDWINPVVEWAKINKN